MQKTIIKPTLLQPNPVSAETPPLTPPGYFARVAMAAGVCALAALSGLAVLLLRAGLPVHPLDMALAVVTLSVLAGGLAGAYWTIRMVERPVRQEDARTRVENDRLRAEMEAMQAKIARPPDLTGFEAHIGLYTLAALHLTGGDTSKRKSGLDPTVHAKAVLIARAVGLIEGERNGTKWTSDDPAVVFERLLLVAKVTPERAWIVTPTGQMSVTLEN